MSKHDKHYTFIVVTPTYNRESLLRRLYESICKQTFKDFLWLVIDDGSIDNTKNLIESFIAEKEIDILYVYKPNGGKHTALIESFKYVHNSKYYYVIDSDDELVPEALQVFFNTWNQIENEGKSLKIGLIKARTKVNGSQPIEVDLFKDAKYVDMTYQNFTIKYKNVYESTTCLRTSELKEYFDIPLTFWHSDKMNYFPEGVLWGRAGRKTKTRYISDVLRVVHLDADGSLCRIKKKKNDFTYLYNYIVAYKYYLTENFDYLWKYQKIRVLKDIVYYLTMSRIVKMPFKESYLEMNLYSIKLLLLFLYPLSIFACFIFKIKNVLKL